MAKEDLLEFEGVVDEILPNAIVPHFVRSTHARYVPPPLTATQRELPEPVHEVKHQQRIRIASV